MITPQMELFSKNKKLFPLVLLTESRLIRGYFYWDAWGCLDKTDLTNRTGLFI
jgi:hypothetical protein